MVKHLLVAVDGSGPSRHAARFALTLARQLGARVTLLTVLPQPEVIPLGPFQSWAVTAQPVSETHMKEMKEQLDAMASEYPDVTTVRAVEVGKVAETILHFAEKQKADMIVMGARGLGPASRFLIGSVSDRVVHHANCPVTVWR